MHMLLKQLLVLTFLIHGVTACQSQSHQTSQAAAAKNKIMQTEEPLINDTFEKLDIAALHTNGRKTQIGIARPDGRMVSGFSYDLESTTDQGVKIAISGNDINGYVKRETPGGGYFTASKEYYPDGNIKTKGLRFINGGFQKGTWYFFNEKGTLSKSINYDPPFKFTFEEVMQFLAAQHIPVEKGPAKPNQGMVTTIWRNEDTLGPVWRIQWLKDKNSMPNIMEEIIIDGNNGKVLKRTDQQYNNS